MKPGISYSNTEKITDYSERNKINKFLPGFILYTNSSTFSMCCKVFINVHNISSEYLKTNIKSYPKVKSTQSTVETQAWDIPPIEFMIWSLTIRRWNKTKSQNVNISSFKVLLLAHSPFPGESASLRLHSLVMLYTSKGSHLESNR